MNFVQGLIFKNFQKHIQGKRSFRLEVDMTTVDTTGNRIASK